MNPYMISDGFNSFSYMYKNANINYNISGSLCRDCARFKPFGVKKCDKVNNVKGDTFSCRKHYIPKSEKGFRN